MLYVFNYELISNSFKKFSGIDLKGILAIGTDWSGVRVFLRIDSGDSVHSYVVPSIWNAVAYLSIYRTELVLHKEGKYLI